MHPKRLRTASGFTTHTVIGGFIPHAALALAVPALDRTAHHCGTLQRRSAVRPHSCKNHHIEPNATAAIAAAYSFAGSSYRFSPRSRLGTCTHCLNTQCLGAALCILRLIRIHLRDY